MLYEIHLLVLNLPVLSGLISMFNPSTRYLIPIHSDSFDNRLST